MTPPLVVGIDGGNSKTDLALVRGDGNVLALVRGPRSSPHYVGVEGCMDVLEQLLAKALARAGLENGRGPIAEVGALLLAGVDSPEEEEQVRAAAEERRLAYTISVANDTFAVLRAGSERGWGVAVVCGTGINCVGVAPDGRQARFPALGTISGDWGGGGDVGREAVYAAARSEDGRGEKTSLERIVPAHFGLETPLELAEAFHRGHIDERRVVELAPVVFAEAAKDAVAARIVDRLADEVVAMIRVTLERLGLTDALAEVVLGGGLIQSGDARLIGAIESALHEIAPEAEVHATSSPPVVGAALLGLDELGVEVETQERARRELGSSFARIGG